MILYSKKIILFISEIKSAVRTILSNEIFLKVTDNRFLSPSQQASYPIRIVIYNHKSSLGYFDPNFYELGFHECLLHAKKETLHNIIRHELAHYITFINYGTTIPPHGTEFHDFCLLRGWGEEVYKASTCLEKEENPSEINESHILRKIKKLMALTTSHNENESQQAMVKAQQLLLKHNMDSEFIADDSEEKIFLKRIMKQKKETAKMRAIAKILETFFVNVVYNRAAGFIYLEILGNAINIEIAEYVAEVLHSELERLWDQARSHGFLKGSVAKNSFFLGIAKGYCNKIQALKREYNYDAANGLMVIEKKLMEAKEMVYERLSSCKSRGSHCPTSSSLGEKMGKTLQINPAIHRSSHPSEALIDYSKF